MTSLVLAKLAIEHASPVLFDGLVPDVDRLLLAACGIVRADFVNGAAAPHAVLALIALRLTSRRFFAYLAALDLPSLGALPTRIAVPGLELVQPDLASIEPRPWYRVAPVAEFAAGTRARLAVFAQRGYLRSIGNDGALALLKAAVRGRGEHAVAQLAHHLPALVNSACKELYAIALDSDFLAAFVQLRAAAGFALVCPPGTTWTDFFHKAHNRQLLDAGARACFDFLREQAVALGVEHEFVLAARARFRHADAKAARVVIVEREPRRTALKAHVNARFDTLSRARDNARARERRAALKRARETAPNVGDRAADADAEAPRPAKRARLDSAAEDEDEDAEDEDVIVEDAPVQALL